MANDAIVRDMLLGTCWSNISAAQDFRQMDLESLKGITTTKPQFLEWETINNTRATLALPGLNKNDIEAKIEGETLIVDVLNWYGQRKFAGKTYRLTLPLHVDRDAVTVSMANGLLTVDYPAKPIYQRTIEVK